MILDTVKVILPAVIAFILGIAMTPFIAGFLYKHRMWKKKAGKIAYDGKDATIFNSLHKEKEVGTPRMGGVIIWLSAFLTILGIWIISKFFPTEAILKIDFLSRDQTWLPFFTLIVGSLVGLIDDFLETKGDVEKMSVGLSLKKRLIVVGAIGILIGFWFFFKLEVTGINIPRWGILEIGWLLIPFFALVTLAIYSGGVIDGIDGLAGGIFAIIFFAYPAIGFTLNPINLAAFCAMLTGANFAFLLFYFS